MIEFSCPKCRAMMSVAESLAGEREACPSCGYLVVVPQPVDDPDADLFEAEPDSPLPVGAEVLPVTVPNYGGVRFIGKVHEVLGWLCCIIGVVVFALALGTGCNWNGPVVGVALFFSGVFQIGIGQLCYCVRDMAINSFYRR